MALADFNNMVAQLDQFQKATLGFLGSTIITSASGEVAGPFAALHAEGSADAVVTFDCAVTGTVHTTWTIPAGGWWVGPVVDVTVVSGEVSAKII